MVGGKNPHFGEEEHLFWIPQDQWTEEISFSCFDEDVGSDDLIGNTTISALQYMQFLEAKDVVLPILHSGNPAGDVLLKIKFFPAGQLGVHCIEAKDLRNVDAIGEQDPYVKILIEGECTKTTKRSKVAKDQGIAPVWNDLLEFDIVDQFTITVECWDADTTGKDDIIGNFVVHRLLIHHSCYRYYNFFITTYIP